MAPAPTPSNPTLVTEEASQRELATTTVARPVARMLALAFCVALLVPTTVQFFRGGFQSLGPVGFPPTRESLSLLGRAVDDTSVLKKWVQPKLQYLLTAAGGFGNEKVAIGRDGWLYYAPGLRYIFGHPFLDPEYLKSKAKAMIDKDGLAVANPDPLPAFRQLAADCKSLGIELLLVPVPDKGMIVRAPLGTSEVVQNPDFSRFRQQMEAAGASVLPFETLIDSADAPWFLKQDTHWTPRFMDRVAQAIAARVKGKVYAETTPQYRLQPKSAASRGDLVAMLKLPEDQTLYGEETVSIEAVEPVGKPAEPEVLLLGDSFTNIYSSPSLQWGQKAGLGEHIAYHLNAPVDTIAMNGAGATVRQELLRAARTGRLAATRVLVYEFAIRDLYLEDWPIVALGNVERKLISHTPVPVASEKAPEPPVSAAASAPEVKAPAVDSNEVEVRGTLVQMSRPIDPGSAPYEDALLYGKLKIDQVVKGTYGPPNAIVVFHAMQKRVLLPGAAHKAGAKLHLRLIRLKMAPEQIRSMQRSDDTEDFDLVPYFVQEELP